MHCGVLRLALCGLKSKMQSREDEQMIAQKHGGGEARRRGEEEAEWRRIVLVTSVGGYNGL